MTTRSDWSMWQVWHVVAVWCFVALAAPVSVRGDGSIAFNGTSSPSGGTSKLENTTANVLNNIKQVTVCCWINPDGLGENSNGYVFVLDPEDDDPATSGFAIYHASTSNTLRIAKYKGVLGTTGVWSIPIADGSWNGVCIRLDFNTDAAPTARVNFTSVTVTQVTAPSGVTELPNWGYCVGNRSLADRTWDGKIAYMQVFNRILSDAEADAGLQAPGSVTSGLRLWLPMTNTSENNDRSGNAFNGTVTDLVTDITGPMVHIQPGVLPGVTVLSHGVINKTQHEIKRFANGVTYPAGQLRGVGPASVIRATADTDDLASNKRGIVITEDYENPIAQWQSDTETTRKAVLQAAVRDLTISGYDETGTEYATGGLVNNQPNLWNKIKGKITNATATMPIRITSAYHSLPTGATAEISDILGLTGANGTRTITRLNGSIMSTSGANPVVVTTTANHNLTNGSSVSISNVSMAPMGVNGIHVISNVTTNTFTIPVNGMGTNGSGGTFDSLDIFSLDSTTGSGTYTAGTGKWTSNYWNDKYDGHLMRSSGLLVDNVNFFYIPGTTLVVKKGGTGGQSGPKLMFDREKARVWDCKVNRAYRGFWIDDVDTVVGRLEGSDLRDYGIKFGRTTAEGSGGGSTQIDGALHFYGVGTGGTDEPAVWFANGAGPSWGGPIYAENAPVGVQIDSSGNRLTNVYSHTCFFRNVAITGQRNSIENFEIDVYNGITETNGGEAILIGNQGNTLSNGTVGGGVFGPIPSGETAIRVRNGTRQTLDNLSFEGTDGSSAPLIRIQHPLTDSVIIARCNNGGTFLELYVVTVGRAVGGSSSTIQLAASEEFLSDELNGATVTITSGPGSGESKTIFDYDGPSDTATISGTWTTVPTSSSTYEVKKDVLGTGNFIEISTGNSITGPAINLDPSGWDDWNNTIIVNGLLQTSPTVELTIASGIVTLTQRNHVVDTESDAASDDLTTINGGATGRMIVLRASNTNRTVVLKDGQGNMKLEGDCSLDNTEDTITLFYDGTSWLEESRRNNGS